MDGYGKRILVIADGTEHTTYYGVAGLADEVRKRRFDAVIANDHLSGFTGQEFAKLCKMTWPDTPLILLKDDLNSLTDHADEFNAAACIPTPYDATMLLSVLHRVTHPVSTEHPSSPWPR